MATLTNKLDEVDELEIVPLPSVKSDDVDKQDLQAIKNKNQQIKLFFSGSFDGHLMEDETEDRWSDNYDDDDVNSTENFAGDYPYFSGMILVDFRWCELISLISLQPNWDFPSFTQVTGLGLAWLT